MNISEAVELMRQGKRVRRELYIGRSVSKCYLEIKKEIKEDEEVIETIMFNCEAITKEHNWVGEYPATSNKWAPSQEDILADDWVEV